MTRKRSLVRIQYIPLYKLSYYYLTKLIKAIMALFVIAINPEIAGTNRRVLQRRDSEYDKYLNDFILRSRHTGEMEKTGLKSLYVS